MQRFFENIESIDAYTRNLACYITRLECAHCKKNDTFMSHGFVYKHRSRDLQIPVGKRIWCSNLNGHTGCGRTFQLYVADQIPGLQYGTAALFIFISSLLAQLSVRKSYQLATSQHETRHAWRWLNKLSRHMIEFRGVVKNRTVLITNTFKNRVRRLQVLLPTLARLVDQFDHCPCFHYQSVNQRPFICEQIITRD